MTSGQLAITDQLTIDGPGADMLTISGNGSSRVIQVGGAKFAIDDLTIADGVATDRLPDNADLGFLAAGGGLLNLGGDVTLTNVNVVGNGTQGFFGAGGPGLFGSVTSGRSDLLFMNIADSTVTGNVAQAGNYAT